MEYHKGIMKTSLSENLRELMVKSLFEKITIKQICDETGVIRATFYNYFDDKYDCLNWIVYRDVVEGSIDKLEQGDVMGALRTTLQNAADNKTFYRTAYNVTGQNSFEDMVRDNLTQAFLIYFKKYRKQGMSMQYDNELLSRYYAESVAFALRMFVFDRGVHSVEDTVKLVEDLAVHSFQDFTDVPIK